MNNEAMYLQCQQERYEELLQHFNGYFHEGLPTEKTLLELEDEYETLYEC